MDEVMHICIKIKMCYLLYSILWTGHCKHWRAAECLPGIPAPSSQRQSSSHTKKSTSSYSHSHIIPVPA